jgi:filamentous hemagglutinin
LTGATALAGVGGASSLGTTAATAACADGDCTNEVAAASQALPQAGQAAGNAVQSVWRMNALQRGAEIEARLGGRSPQLPYNFPGIDRFENGVATSIKSIDLGAKTYQDVGSLTNKVQGYVSDLANWSGSTWPSAPIAPTDISSRILLLAIPQGATADQLLALQQLQTWAQTVNVTLNTVVVP